MVGGGYGVRRIMEAEEASFLDEFMRRAMGKENGCGVSSALTRSVRELPPDKVRLLFDKLDGIGSDVCKTFRRSLFAFEDVASLDVDTPVGVSIQDFTATKGCYYAKVIARC